MKLGCFLGCLLAIAPLELAAQNGGASFGVAGMEGRQNGGAMRSVMTGPNGQTTSPNLCPVSMQASHLSDGSMIKTGPTHPKGAHPKGIGQRLHLTLTSPDQRTIVSATLEVRGWNATGRMERAALRNEDQSARTVTVSFTAGPARTASADVWASGLTAVTSVELLSVSYSDGSTWKLTQGKTCSVSPDPMMLIANQQKPSAQFSNR